MAGFSRLEIDTRRSRRTAQFDRVSQLDSGQWSRYRQSNKYRKIGRRRDTDNDVAWCRVCRVATANVNRIETADCPAALVGVTTAGWSLYEAVQTVDV